MLSLPMSLHILIGIFDDRNIHSDIDDGWSESAYQFTVNLTDIRHQADINQESIFFYSF